MIKQQLERIRNSRFSRDTLWLMGAQAVLMVSGFGVNLLVGKVQGAEALGIFNQALAFYTILSTFFALGLNNTVTKKIAEGQRSPEETRVLLTSNLLLTACFSGVMSALVCLLALEQPTLFSSPELARVVYIPMMALPFFNINKNVGAYFTGLRLQKRFAQQRILRWSIIILFVLCCILAHQSIDIILWCFFAAEAILFCINMVQLRSRMKFQVSMATLKDNLRFGMKTYIAELISVLNSSLDVILIGYFLSNAETGIYSFIIYFAKTLYIFPGIMMQNFSPIVSRTWANGQLEELKGRMNSIRKVNRQVVSAQLIALMVVYPIITSVVKQEFHHTLHLLLITLSGAYLYSLISWSGSMLIMSNKLNENIVRTGLIIVASAACTLSCTFGFGLIGAIVAFSLNNLISFFATAQFIKRSMHVSVI